MHGSRRIGACLVAALLPGVSAYAAPRVYLDAGASTLVEVHIFGDPIVSKCESIVGTLPWTVESLLSASGLNGTGNGPAGVRFALGPFCVSMVGASSVFAAGSAGGTSARTSMNFRLLFIVTEHTGYSLTLNSFAAPCGINGPGLNIPGFNLNVSQSGILEPGQFTFSGFTEASAFGGARNRRQLRVAARRRWAALPRRRRLRSSGDVRRHHSRSGAPGQQHARGETRRCERR